MQQDDIHFGYDFVVRLAILALAFILSMAGWLIKVDAFEWITGYPGVVGTVGVMMHMIAHVTGCVWKEYLWLHQKSSLHARRLPGIEQICDLDDIIYLIQCTSCTSIDRRKIIPT